MEKKKIIIVIGSGPSVDRSIELVRDKHSDYEVLQVSFGGKSEKVSESEYLRVVGGYRKNIVDSVKEKIGEREVIAVVNRVDSHIVLHGILVSEFHVPGPSYEQVMCGRDKTLFHEKMLSAGLSENRPKSRIIDLDEFLDSFEYDFPYVVKPSMGSKSRGVYVVKDVDDYREACEYLGKYFKNSRSFRGYEGKEKVIVEEFIENGKQFTLTCYADNEGKLVNLQGVDVLTGRDVGQNHQQLVYRFAPSLFSDEIIEKAEEVLRGFVKECGFRSVFFHPEFLVAEDKVYLIEVNVRVGGFRGEMLQYTMNKDIDEMVVRLALGEELEEVEYLGEVGCCAVEVWEEKSGVLEEFDVPGEVVNLKQFVEAGDMYIAPPTKQVPIARFYVVGEGSQIEKAKKIRKEIRLEIV